MWQTKLTLPEFFLRQGSLIRSVSPICESCQFQEVAAPSTQILWTKSQSHRWLLSFPHALTAAQVSPSEASDKDIVEQSQAIPTLPCLNFSSTECPSMIRWSLFHDTELRSGRWPEHIPLIRPSSKHIHYFIRILLSIFQLISPLFIVCYIFLSLYSTFHSKFHSIHFYSITVLWSIAHWFHDTAYSVPFYDSFPFNFYFLLLSLIFYFTAHSIPFLCSYNVTHVCIPPAIRYLFALPFPSHFFHHIPFNFQTNQLSIPYLVQSAFYSLFHSSVHCRQSPFHCVLHSISNPFSTTYHWTLPIPLQATLHCVSLQMLIQSSKHPIAFGHNC